MAIREKVNKPIVVQTDFVDQEEEVERIINRGGSVASLEKVEKQSIARADINRMKNKEDDLACFSLRVPKSFVPRLDALRKKKDVISSRNQTIVEILERAFESLMV